MYSMNIDLWRGLWSTLNTDIKISWDSALLSSIDSIQSVLEISRVINENRDADELAFLIPKISSLLDILNSPMGQVIGVSLPLVSIGSGLLRFIATQTHKEPSMEISVAISSQVAYIKSMQKHLKNYADFELDRSATKSISRKLKELAKFSLDEEEAKRIFICFHQSSLAKKFNAILYDRLKEVGMNDVLAKRLTEKISCDVHRYIKEVFRESEDSIRSLKNMRFIDYEADLREQISIDDYLRDQISPETRLPEQIDRWRIFSESFTLQDIYVPLKARLLDKKNRSNEQSVFSLEGWAKEFLISTNPAKRKQVMFVQAGPGRGKTVFCKIFANWVRENLHPIWTPILIRLRDIETWEGGFEMTLRSAVYAQFSQSQYWLHNPNIRFLFILDGFDELLMQKRSSLGLEDFLERVAKFQRICQETGEMQHQVIITGRTLALQEIEQQLPSNLERVEILPMLGELQEEWLRKWESKIGVEQTLSFRRFLRNENIPESVRGNLTDYGKAGLAQEPLILYLLAAMHRDGELSDGIFEGVEATQAKILIYERSLNWALSRKHSDNTGTLSRKLTKLEPDQLRHILRETGLCIVQSGGEWASIEMISDRLKEKEEIRFFLENAKRSLGGKDSLRNALVSFYLQPKKNTGSIKGGVEFIHKSFGEFLCAEKIKDILSLWSERFEKREQSFCIDKSKLIEQAYDTFGFGPLSPEVMSFLVGLLTSELKKIQITNREQEFKNEIKTVFERLERFFDSWCAGDFIDDFRASFPLRTIQKSNLPSLKQRQVDIYTGLNILILLLEINKITAFDLNFRFCRDVDSVDGKIKLSKVISYCRVLGASTFIDVMGKFMSGAPLQDLYLRRADLRGATLNEANLSNADLCRADLTEANLENCIAHNIYLRGADLKGVGLMNAKLINADLCRAYLLNADLREANLFKASLKGANLEGANLENAILKNIIWDSATQWFCCEGLHKAKEIPDELELEEDFIDSRELSICLEILKKGEIDRHLAEQWRVIATRIKKRRGNLIYAHILNKFAWLNCLYGNREKYIVEMAKDAVSYNRSCGNYLDTFAVAQVLYYDATGVAFYPENLDDNETIYRSSIVLFEQALESDDFKKLALPVAQKTIQRRKDWIEELEQSRNPFTTEVLSVLFREER